MAKSATAVCEVLPPLPCGCVDLDVLGAALNAGMTGEEAIAEATAPPELPSETPAPAPIPEITE